MNLYQPIDYIPLWALFAGTVLMVLLAMEGGYRLGSRHRRRREHEHEAAAGAMAAATLALLAFMLAFTFGMAASRFDARRDLVLEEANAIGTCYLRAQMIPEPYREEIRNLLRQYVVTRVEGVQKGRVEEAIAKSEQMQDQIWSRAAAVGEENPESIVVGLFIQSLNDVIDVHSKRVTAVLNRIPATIWIALYFVSLLGMTATGYHSGLTGLRSTPMYVLLVLTFSAVLWLIADLDRPGAGFLRVSQHPMIELKNKLTAPVTAAERPGMKQGSLTSRGRSNGESSRLHRNPAPPAEILPTDATKDTEGRPGSCSSATRKPQEEKHDDRSPTGRRQENSL